MSMDKVKEQRAALFERIVADMREKGPEWQREWSVPAPFNPKTQSVYRGRNALLLTFYMRERGLADPRFMTFSQAKAEGFHVRKGCHSYPIEKWKKMAYNRADPARRIKQPRTPEEWKAAEEDPDLGFRFVVVGSWNLFSAADIEGIEPYVAPGAAVGESELIDFLEENSPCPVIEQAGGGAFYSPGRDAITMPTREQFFSELGMGRVLLHEQSHATGHELRLGRDLHGAAFGSPDYAREELCAELSSLFTANALGLKLPALGRDDAFSTSKYWENHVAYLQSWTREFEDPASELMLAVSRAGAASDWLIDNCFAGPLEKLGRTLERPRTREAAPQREQVVDLSGPKRQSGPAPSLERDLRAASDAAKARKQASFRREPALDKQ